MLSSLLFPAGVPGGLAAGLLFVVAACASRANQSPPTPLPARTVEAGDRRGPVTHGQVGGTSELTPPAAEAGAGFVPLFNGRDLAGWTPKFAKHPLGVNLHDTFRVEDGILKVAYDKYPAFDRQFGHLYSNLAYSHYILRLEYRFVGKPMADAPPWAGYNSGVMVHAAPPQSMTLAQEWPVSLELQFLCTDTKAGRQTGNACTPGTHIEVDGKLTTAHIIEAGNSTLSPMEEWVAAEIEVHGHDLVIHRINGKEVLRYTRPQLDPKDPDARRLIAAGHPLRVGFGHIALQAESQPVWFRNIRLMPLPPAP